VAKTNSFLPPGRLCGERGAQPVAVREPLKYLPRRDAISALVSLELAKLRTRPSVKALGKFNAGGIEKRPSQMIQIHPSSIEGPTRLVNAERRTRSGRKRGRVAAAVSV
jgi:hypothetical protein